MQLKTGDIDPEYGKWRVAFGQFKNGTSKIEGVGIEVDRVGAIKEGYWKEGQLHGQGRYICNDYYYIGEFKNGLYHGQGTEYFKDGRVIASGMWDNHKFVG